VARSTVAHGYPHDDRPVAKCNKDREGLVMARAHHFTVYIYQSGAWKRRNDIYKRKHVAPSSYIEGKGDEDIGQ